MKNNLVLVTGVTGHVGGRLVPQLLQTGYQVRVLVRDRNRLHGYSWLDQVEVAEGDALVHDSLHQALSGVATAYYLIHSMKGNGDHVQLDLQAARNFGNAARLNGIERIIYLSGLGDPETDLARHLRSRHTTGQVLKESGVPVTEFRTAIVVGSGSISFEMIRYLTERVPVMICPFRLSVRVQPIATRDVLDYLVAALRTPESEGRIIEIGGPDVLSYGDLMSEYARGRGLRRWLVSIPMLGPRLAAIGVQLLTPIPASIAHPLIEGLRNEVIVREPLASELFPHLIPMDYKTAVSLALADSEKHPMESSWGQGEIVPVARSTQEGMIIERRQQVVPTTPAMLFKLISQLGGQNGWLYLNWAWHLRGWLDRLVGGVGMRNGPRDPEMIRVGEVIDFWRVEAVEADKRLLLRAELKFPGRAWLQFETYPYAEGRTRLVQTSFLAPRGLSGLAYYYLFYPIHGLVFAGLIRNLAKMGVMSN